MKIALALFLPLLSTPALGAAPWHETLDSAVSAAQSKKTLVLVDFYAPWCYSCYYMDQNVLNQPEFRALAGQAELVKVDVDSPEGAKLKKDWRVSFLPSYVFLDADRKEIGRILGERPRAEFFLEAKAILRASAPLAALEAKAKSGELAAARDALGLHVKRRSFEDGLAFHSALPAAVQKEIQKDSGASLSVLRLKLLRADGKKDQKACAALAPQILKRELGCDLPYDGGAISRCLDGQKAELRRAYALAEPRLEELLAKRVFGPKAERCADFRSPVEFAASIYAATKRPADADRVVARAIDAAKADLGGDVRSDRSMADNLRAFLEKAGRQAELDELYPKLTAAYPDEYVYYHRYGRHLLGAKRPAEALAQFDLALPRAYGSNRLKVIEFRAKALAELGRKAEALDALEKAVKDNPASFPDEVSSLSKLMRELQP